MTSSPRQRPIARRRSPDAPSCSCRPAWNGAHGAYRLSGSPRVKHHAAHRVRERLRFKIEAARENPALLDSLKEVFADVPAIGALVAKPDCGSLLLQYDPRLEAETEARFASHSSEHVEVSRDHPGNAIDRLASKLEAEAEFLAGRSRRTHAAVAFFAAATPMWVTLVRFALNHFIEQHPPPAPATATA